MLTVLALLFLAIYAVLIHRMTITGNLVWCQLGVVSIFSIGYYVLPVLFRPASTLAGFSGTDIATVLLMHGLFWVAILVGVMVGMDIFPGRIRLSMGLLDERFARHRRKLFVVSFVPYVWLVTSYPQTGYSAEDSAVFYANPDPYAAILSALAGLLLAVLGLCLAVELKSGRKLVATAMAAGIFVIVGISLRSAQRLVMITPLITVVAALRGTLSDCQFGPAKCLARSTIWPT